MKIEKISTKLIKPHTPTPQNLKNFNISFADKNQIPMNVGVVLFHQSKPEYDTVLIESLARILVQFYPLAGRFMKNDNLVDCSDQGVEFVRAEAQDVELIDLVAKAEINQIKFLLSDQYFKTDEAATDPLLSIQVTDFVSGGLAIAISVSHRVFDGASLGTFITAWSNATNPDKMVEVTPSYELPLLLPLRDNDYVVNREEFSIKNDFKFVVKRFLFKKEALTSLRSRISPNTSGRKISGVRLVCAVIAKTLIGLDQAKHGVERDFLIYQPVNMRERTIPPQPKHACGNFLLPSLTRRVHASQVKEIGIREIVDIMGDAVRKSIEHHVEIFSPNRDARDIILSFFGEFLKELQTPETNVIYFTDWSKFGFDEVDFGWGKPVWTSIGPQSPPSNSTVFMSNKEGDEIEAWVHLSQSDMVMFEQDEDIKLFTT